MNRGLPSALIIGIDHFVAKNLAQELVNKDIKVVGVGNYVSGLNEMSNFEWASDLDEVEGNFSYVFDFGGDKKDWEKIEAEKFVLLSINDKLRSLNLKQELEGWKKDWRLVESEGVYGEGMSEDDFLSQVIRLAVQNKNLELPSPKKTIRLLSVTDLTEAILRATFLSGTEEEKFLVLGKEISFEGLAKVLMDKAKMTRFKVLEKDEEINQGSDLIAQNSEKKLRWVAKIEFEDGVEGVLQYFFSKMDEENRHPTKVRLSSHLVGQEKIEGKSKGKMFDVAIEENNIDEINPFIKKEVMVSEEVKKEEVVEIKKPVLVDYTNQLEEKEVKIEKIEIKPIEVQKSKKEIETDYIEEESEDFEDINKINLPTPQKVEKKLETKRVEKKFRKIKISGKWWIFLLILILILLVEPIKWFVVTSNSVKNIQQIPELIKNKKYLQAEKMADNSIEGLTKIDEKINDWSLNKFNTFRNYQTALKVGGDVLVLEKKAIELAKTTDLMSEAMFFEKTINWSDELDELNNQLREIESYVGVLQARLNGDYSWIPARWKMLAQKQMKTVEEMRDKLEVTRRFVKVLPEFLGLDGGVKQYLVLFQNESELRPTGGFIGSYGILKFEKGRLLGLDVKDVYEADGQLKGHVEPPWEIKNILNEAKWFMRDANWKADFTKTSADIQWFFEKETGQKVDGVIGIDLAVAKSFLKVIGEVYVSDFKETINEANLYEQAEFYAETKFFPGSVQKASFLGAVGKQLFEEIKALSVEKKINLLQSMIELLEQNEIQIALNNQPAAEIITDLGWDGKIYNGKCGVDDCMSDYLFVVEANLGVNKANYFLNRNIDQTINITQNQVERILKINYENKAKNNNWPGGDYKNYLRVYLPKDVTLSQVKVVDAGNVANFKVYNNDELRIKEVDGKKEVGFLVIVPTLKKRVVEISYSSKINLVGKTKFNYISYIQRQSGSGETGLVSLITYPSDWQPIQVQPVASLVGGKLLFNQKLNKDIKMGVELGK